MSLLQKDEFFCTRVAHKIWCYSWGYDLKGKYVLSVTPVETSPSCTGSLSRKEYGFRTEGVRWDEGPLFGDDGSGIDMVISSSRIQETLKTTTSFYMYVK